MVVSAVRRDIAATSSPSDLPPSDLPPSDLPPSDLPPSDLPPSDLSPFHLSPFHLFLFDPPRSTSITPWGEPTSMGHA